MNVTFTAETTAFADALGDALALDAEGRADVMEAVDGSLSEAFDRNLRTGGEGSWKPLAPATAERKAKLGLGTLALVATGALRDALTKDGGDHVRESSQDGTTTNFSVGVEGDAARILGYHREGTETLPRRDPSELDAESARRLKDALATAVGEAIARRLGALR
ncbi:MAG: hypothetical protein ABFD84_01125 [Candidatus Polarisedimenticolia bacterium]